nr:signal peptidase I [Acanthopleuribacter pedis]
MPFGNVRAFEVADQNMEPSILLGDRILVDTTAYQDAPIKRGDIVAFRFPLQPNQIWLKRVIGLPGEEVRSDGSLMQINGEPVTNEPIIGLQPLMSIYGGIKGDELLYRRLLKCHWEEVDSRKYAIVYDGNPVRKKAFFYKSKENEFFLLGDRRDKSIDSRDFGPVTKESIIGKVHSIWRSENTHRIGVYKEIGSKE